MTNERREWIGIFGGTFNPPHLAHLIAGELAVERYSLDRLLFIPANIPPHKQRQQITLPEHRLQMLKLALKDNPRFEISTIEIDREGTSYTVDTLSELKSLHPTAELNLFIGMDNLAIFHSWRRTADILQMAKVVVMTRPTHDLNAVEPKWLENVELMPIPLLEISSTEIRKRVSDGQSIRYQVTSEVEEYIRTHALFMEGVGASS